MERGGRVRKCMTRENNKGEGGGSWGSEQVSGKVEIDV